VRRLRLEIAINVRLMMNRGEQNSKIAVFILFTSFSLLNHKKKAKKPKTNPVYRVIELLKR
jgi:hypothetical protein